MAEPPYISSAFFAGWGKFHPESCIRSMKYMPVWVAVLATSSTAAFAMPRGSFLLAPAPTRAALIKALQEPSTVAGYRKATGRSREALVTIFKRLRLIRLTHDQVMSVWFMTHSRKGAYWRLRHLRAGLLVWVTPEGKGFLIAMCGNPVQRPPTPLPPITEAPPFPPSKAPPLVHKSPLPPPVVDLTPPILWPPGLEDLPPGELGPPVVEAPPVEGIPPDIDLVPPEFGGGQPGGSPPLGDTPHHKRAFPWWDILWLAPVGLFFIHGGHGAPATGIEELTPPIVKAPIPLHAPGTSSSSGGSSTPPPINLPSPPTPEPGGMVTMSVGALTTAAAGWQLRKRGQPRP
jgi:hypothetical protein